MVASLVISVVGVLLLGLGAWIVLLRIEGFVDHYWPHNIAISAVTVDGQESKGPAEFLRARFDHHFRRPVAIAKQTGFLEVAALEAPGLFQPTPVEGPLKKMTISVSGVDVGAVVKLVDLLAKPDEWTVDADFQTQAGRVLMALRLRRGPRLIRTWYLERQKGKDEDKSATIERLIDDAIFRLVYDFLNSDENDPDLKKWRPVIRSPTRFSGPAAVAAYYEGRGALGRYYASGDWRDLEIAVDRLRTLRGHEPEFADGLELLAMALAEKREDEEAIHVYDQLRLVLARKDDEAEQIWQHRRRLHSVDLLEATVTAKLGTPSSTHDAVRQLDRLREDLEAEQAKAPEDERAKYDELRAHTAVQLAQTYALYLDLLRHHTAAEVLGPPEAPDELRVKDQNDLEKLKNPQADAEEVKGIVRGRIEAVAKQHRESVAEARSRIEALENRWPGPEPERREKEVVSRLELAQGYASYRMAELEDDHAAAEATVLGKTFGDRLSEAKDALGRADANHPNHYVVLQLLGLAYSEPRCGDRELSVAEQYFARAAAANPSDHAGHELLAELLARRIANRGVALASRGAIEKGLAEAEQAVARREVSGGAHRVRAELQTMLLEVERDAAKRKELRAGLDESLGQADRFLPKAFGESDPDLTWLRLVAGARRLGEEAEAAKATAGRDLERRKALQFDKSKRKLLGEIERLDDLCAVFEKRWVAQQRVFQIRALRARMGRLGDEVRKATLESWRDIFVPFR